MTACRSAENRYSIDNRSSRCRFLLSVVGMVINGRRGCRRRFLTRSVCHQHATAAALQQLRNTLIVISVIPDYAIEPHSVGDYRVERHGDILTPCQPGGHLKIRCKSCLPSRMFQPTRLCLAARNYLPRLSRKVSPVKSLFLFSVADSGIERLCALLTCMTSPLFFRPLTGDCQRGQIKLWL